MVMPAVGVTRHPQGRTATIVVAASDSAYRFLATPGFICTGTADDVVIQRALDAVTGGRVILLEGTYNCAANITIGANEVLEGQGFATILNFDDPTITNALILGGGNSGIKNLKAQLAAGCGTAGARPNVIYATSVNRIWIENLWVVGDTSVADDGVHYRQCGILFDTVTDSHIVNCRIEDNDRHGIHIYDGSNYNTINHNTCQGNTQKGIFLRESCYNTIDDNTCYGNHMQGIDLHNTSVGNTVSANECCSNYREGIYLYDSCDENTIAGNTCLSNLQTNICLGNSSKCTISGNTCNKSSYHGIDLFGGSDNNTITGNTCSQNTYEGIQVRESDYAVITGNQCEGGRRGIRIRRAEFCTLTGNVCENQSIGIFLEGTAANNCDNNTIMGNVSTNNTWGIAINGGANADSNIVVGNQLKGNSIAFADNGANTQIGHNIEA